MCFIKKQQRMGAHKRGNGGGSPNQSVEQGGRERREGKDGGGRSGSVVALSARQV